MPRRRKDRHDGRTTRRAPAARIAAIRGARAVLLHGPEPTLLAGDLHFGFEDELERAGIHLPSQGASLAGELQRLVDETRAARVILLGDVKHGIGAGPRERDAVRPLAELSVPYEIVPGNHDGAIAHLLSAATVHGPGGILRDGVALFHGHTWPAKAVMTARLCVATHNHPVVALRDDLGHVHREPCFLRVPFAVKARDRYPDLPRGARLLVVPAFNPLLSGVAVNDPDTNALGPLFRNRFVDIARGRVATVDGIELGTVAALRRRLVGL